MAIAQPVAISTVMVSPIARPMPSILAAIMPDAAAGIFTKISVCHFVAPRAREASSNDFGTLFNASSVRLMIVGNAITANNIDPLRAFNPLGI